jgi:hypothetical protein
MAEASGPTAERPTPCRVGPIALRFPHREWRGEDGTNLRENPPDALGRSPRPALLAGRAGHCFPGQRVAGAWGPDGMSLWALSLLTMSFPSRRGGDGTRTCRRSGSCDTACRGLPEAVVPRPRTSQAPRAVPPSGSASSVHRPPSEQGVPAPDEPGMVRNVGRGNAGGTASGPRRPGESPMHPHCRPETTALLLRPRGGDLGQAHRRLPGLMASLPTDPLPPLLPGPSWSAAPPWAWACGGGCLPVTTTGPGPWRAFRRPRPGLPAPLSQDEPFPGPLPLILDM